jgi:ubiquinone/menaquinone biosynthesis C-methylase UbiE
MAKSQATTQDLDSQYRRPFGTLGRKIGREMAHNHLPENLWTIAQLKPQTGDHILEIGFGPGVAIQELSKVVTTGLVAGVDFSETMVREASKRNASAIQMGFVELHYGDASALPFADAAFDKAYSIHSIYFWPQPLKALTELHRVLKPGGQLVITILPKHRWPPNAPGSSLDYGTPECTPYFSHELEMMMVAAGFGSTRVVVDTDSTHKSNFSVLGVK